MIESNVYDEEEVHHNCTVQVWRNSVTGEVSIGWEENEDSEAEYICKFLGKNFGVPCAYDYDDCYEDCKSSTPADCWRHLFRFMRERGAS